MRGMEILHESGEVDMVDQLPQDQIPVLEHAPGIVIGESAVIEDNVSMLHGVTLGGTGKETGDRHP